MDVIYIIICMFQSTPDPISRENAFGSEDMMWTGAYVSIHSRPNKPGEL